MLKSSYIMLLRAELKGKDSIEVECAGDDPRRPGAIQKISVVGCANFMEMALQMKKRFGADISKWPLPEGKDHSSLIFYEMILKLRGEWTLPYQEEELCHCRMISTHDVEQAIIAGAHTPDAVTRVTSASTSCGTCRPNVQKIIQYRLGQNV